MGALLPQARAALPRSPVVSGVAGLHTHSIRLQPWTGSLFPQASGLNRVPLGTRMPSRGLGWEVTCPPDAAQEEHGLASGVDLTFQQMSLPIQMLF